MGFWVRTLFIEYETPYRCGMAFLLPRKDVVMCLAIYKPRNELIDWDALEQGFRSNSDGSGFAVVHKDNVIIHKGFFDFAEFKSALEPFAKCQAAIHFRKATHGKKDGDNCHPFPVSDGLAMIHNGVLDIQCDEKHMSDTWHYCEYVIKPMASRDKDFFMHDDMVFLGSQAISGSKFVFLRSDGMHSIWNEDDGHWNGDTWYSNYSYAGHSTHPFGSTSLLDEAKYAYSYGESADDSMYRGTMSFRHRSFYEELMDDYGYGSGELDLMIQEKGFEVLDDALTYHEYTGGDAWEEGFSEQ